MTWIEYNAARQLLIEERAGASTREVQRAEDAAVLGLKDAIRRQHGSR